MWRYRFHNVEPVSVEIFFDVRFAMRYRTAATILVDSIVRDKPATLFRVDGAIAFEAFAFDLLESFVVESEVGTSAEIAV